MGVDMTPGDPVVFAFISVTALLGLGYLWGRRRNERIARDVVGRVVRAVHPCDQTFTLIGGAVGMHARLLLGEESAFSEALLTVILLPRQAPLYFPVSFLIHRSDRLFVTLKARGDLPGEGHLVAVSGRGGTRISPFGENDATAEGISWGGIPYRLASENHDVKERLQGLVRAVEAPGGIQHVALVPGQGHVFIRVALPDAGLEAALARLLSCFPRATAG